MSVNQIVRVVPVLKVNNRNANQAFFTETLGMKSLVEEAAFLSLGDASKIEKIVLEESPSMRSRKVRGLKKLARMIVKATIPEEITYLLARKPAVSAVYQGDQGVAFEAISPDGDRVLLHAEENLASLKELDVLPDFEAPASFQGLSSFSVESVELHVADLDSSLAVYQKFPALMKWLHLIPAQGPDLEVDNGLVWDLSALKVELAEQDLESLKEAFADEVTYMSRKGDFFLAKDSSHIELCFEAAQENVKISYEKNEA